jgi:hypothetical protein
MKLTASDVTAGTKGGRPDAVDQRRLATTEIPGVMSPDAGMSDLAVSPTVRRHHAEIISNSRLLGLG